jgi:hypothetical protein
MLTRAEARVVHRRRPSYGYYGVPYFDLGGRRRVAPACLPRCVTLREIDAPLCLSSSLTPQSLARLPMWELSNETEC